MWAKFSKDTDRAARLGCRIDDPEKRRQNTPELVSAMSIAFAKSLACLKVTRGREKCTLPHAPSLKGATRTWRSGPAVSPPSQPVFIPGLLERSALCDSVIS